MKVNVPVTEEQHAAAAAEHSRLAKSQKRFCASLADRIEAGETLSAYERAFAADALRHVGANIGEKRRPAGKPPMLPDYELVMEFVVMTRHQSVRKNNAYERLAEKYGVSVTAVKNRLGLGKSPEAVARRAEINSVLHVLGQPPI